MAQNNVDGIESTVQETNVWLNKVARELHTDDRQRAYLVLRAFLHATRNQLPIDEAAGFAAQLPVLLKGVYYDGWNPSKTPETLRSRTDYLDEVQKEAVFAADMDPERGFAAAAKLVAQHMTGGQMTQLLNALPGDIRQLLKPAA
jgi:uncharacterized protein (DUF2267 family)